MKGANKDKENQVKKQKKTPQTIRFLNQANLPQYTVLEIKERLWDN